MALHDLTLKDVLSGLEARSFSAEELTRALIVQAARFADINAFIAFDEDRILAGAREADARRAAATKRRYSGRPSF